jgi:hypothetical protein
MIPETAEIKDKILELISPSHPNFQGWPINLMGGLENWGNLLVWLTEAIVPASATQNAAKLAFVSAGLSLPVAGMPALVSAFTAFATTLGAGMTGYVATPPPAIDFSAASAIGLNGGSVDDCAHAYAITIREWISTGTSSNISGTIIWS